MESAQRLFVAADVPLLESRRMEGITEELADLPGARWVPSQNLHITLRFLGRVLTSRRPELDASFRDAVDVVPMGEIAIQGLGGFPRPARATVLWAGLVDLDETLSCLAARLERAVEMLGLPADERPFHAHLTLARFKKAVDLRSLPRLPAGAPWRVKEVHLFSSKPGSGAPVYERISSYPLASGS